MTTQEVATNTATATNVRTRTPRVELSESNDAISLVADMPGVAPEDVSVELDDGVLTLQGDVAADDSRTARRYRRQFTINDAALFDLERVAAKMANGVLEVRLPKASKPAPRQIAITAT